jgi:caa(3)-type oxidase subunit IV
MILTRTRDYLLTWVGLMILLAIEAVGGRWLGWGNATPFIGIVMAAGVGMVLMHLRHGTGEAKIFAFTGALWLVIMLSLTMMDIVTRSPDPVSQATPGSSVASRGG